MSSVEPSSPSEPIEDRVEVTGTTQSSSAQIWRALTTDRSTWWPEMTFEPSVGAPLREVWATDGVEHEATGEVTDVRAPTLLRFNWTQSSWPGGSATVQITIAVNDGVTTIRVVETGLAAASGSTGLLDEHRAGWAWHLEQLVLAASR